MPDFKLAKIGSRLVQPGYDDGEPSLLAKAFRDRLLENSTADPALLYPARQGKVKVRVAVYNDTRIRFLIVLRRILLSVVAPLIALMIVGFVIFSTFNQPKASVPIATESVALIDVPVPAGVRPLLRAANYSPKSFVDVYLNQAIPGYSDEFKSSATFIGPLTQNTLNDFYTSRLLQNKSLGWQGYGKPTIYNITYTSLYVRGLSSQVPGSIEALVVEFEPVNPDILKQDPSYYDRQTNLNETVITLSKSWLTPRR